MRVEVKILSVILFCFFCLPIAAGAQQNKDLGLKTVVIDPGHGGKDPGALGKTSSKHEKHIVLNISKLLGQKIKAAYPDVKVVYTRNTDVFLELKERVNVAKRNNADLFISLHCNSNNSSATRFLYTNSPSIFVSIQHFSDNYNECRKICCKTIQIRYNKYRR